MPATVSRSEVIDAFRRQVGKRFAGRDVTLYFLPEDPFHEDDPGAATLNFVAVFDDGRPSDAVGVREAAEVLNAEYDFDPYLHVRTSAPRGRYARVARKQGVRL